MIEEEEEEEEQQQQQQQQAKRATRQANVLFLPLFEGSSARTHTRGVVKLNWKGLKRRKKQCQQIGDAKGRKSSTRQARDEEVQRR